jgi:hypothetical protein
MTALRTLLARSIDYAGLFPPARLSMADAVSSYAEYLGGADSDLLGRFVVPAVRLDEFAEAADRHLPRGERSTPWRLSVLARGDFEADRETMLEFNSSHGNTSSRGRAVAETVEAVGKDPAEVRSIRESFSDFFTTFIEVPVDSTEALIPVIASSGSKAKVRTGGVTRDAFPKAEDIAAFIAACHRTGIAFKATAGLHHPLRGEYPLSYETGSERGTMYGYLNLFLAVAAIIKGNDSAVAVEALLENDSGAIAVHDSFLTWRKHRYDEADLKRLRESLLLSFGSCSFIEPIGEARALGLLH